MNINKRSIGFRIESGPNASVNPDPNMGVGDPTVPVTRPSLKQLAGLVTVAVLARLASPDDSVQDPEDSQRVLRIDQEIDTGHRVYHRADGSQEFVAAGSQEIPEDMTPSLARPEKSSSQFPAGSDSTMPRD